jgi:hypothetical protein
LHFCGLPIGLREGGRSLVRAAESWEQGEGEEREMGSLHGPAWVQANDRSLQQSSDNGN